MTLKKLLIMLMGCSYTGPQMFHRAQLNALKEKKGPYSIQRSFRQGRYCREIPSFGIVQGGISGYSFI